MKIKFGQDVGTLVVTDVSDINNKNIDFKKQILVELPLSILVQDKGRWSKDSTFQPHPPAVPWVERIKIGGRN